MREITLTVDKDANQTVKELMSYYNMKSEEEIFGLGLKLVAIAATIDNSDDWELLARNKKNKREKLFDLS